MGDARDTVLATREENKGMLFPGAVDYLMVTDDNKERRFVMENKPDNV